MKDYLSDSVILSRNKHLSLAKLHAIIYKGASVDIDEPTIARLDEQRNFIEYLLQNNIKVYGLTSGFADLREAGVTPNQAALLSANLLLSHDAGIGDSLPEDVVLGAMVIRANSLCKGYSGFTIDGIRVLLQMINARIIPLIPSSGSLGASGDLAFLARLGRAMQGHKVPVMYRGKLAVASDCLAAEGISPFEPQAKEGLALTNGTSFMASMIAIAYLKEVRALENILAMQGLFLNAIEAVDAAFADSIQTVRGQKGQKIIAAILRTYTDNSPLIDRNGVQNDYCIRCLPQILGPRIEIILEQYPKIVAELEAVTDNPLIFKGEEISSDIPTERCFTYNNEKWAVLSGGNFHGEYLTVIADTILASNAKIILTLERQLTYMLNPFRNKKKLPVYLIPEEGKAGLQSGFMITQYTANALAQKISCLALPNAMFNLTSGNEAEDVVSYGATATETLLKQLTLVEQFLSIYLTVTLQAYAIKRRTLPFKEDSTFPAEQLFKEVTGNIPEAYPFEADCPLSEKYSYATTILKNGLPNSIPLMGAFSLDQIPERTESTTHSLV